MRGAGIQVAKENDSDYDSAMKHHRHDQMIMIGGAMTNGPPL